MMATDLDAMLRSSDPLRDGDTPVDSGVLAAVADAVVLGPTAQRRRTRRRKLLAAAAAGLVVVPGAAWASSKFLAETGVFGKPGMTENDTSQYIDVCAKDFPAYYATLPTPAVAPPAGLTWQQVERFIVGQIKTSFAADCHKGGVVQQVTGLNSKYLITAWTVYDCRAYQAHKQGDDVTARANMTLAADTMDEFAAAHLFGDTNWIPWRDAERRGDFTMMSQSWRANTVGAPTPDGVCR